MKAMVLHRIHDLSIEHHPLSLENVDVPEISGNEILIKISSCGVCHTELDEIEGRTAPPIFPVIPGHQVIGHVKSTGPDTVKFKPGDRAGIAWIHSSCGQCAFCLNGMENLCKEFKATGRDVNGGYAEYMKISEDFAFEIPDFFTDTEAAPLFCAGAIGYRSLKLSTMENGKSLGFSGFGASAHLVLKLAKYLYPDSEFFVFARNKNERVFAKDLGAVWAGDFDEKSPDGLDVIIDTTPVWFPVIKSLENLKPGGRLIINAIRKEDIDKPMLSGLNFENHLWLEKEIKSVANITKNDVIEFLKIAAEAEIKPEIEEFALEDANKAIIEMKEKKIRGAKILRIS